MPSSIDPAGGGGPRESLHELRGAPAPPVTRAADPEDSSDYAGEVRHCILALLLLAGPDDGCFSLFAGAEPPEEGPRRAATELWLKDCADCHGITGAVDGSLSAQLDPKPPSFADPCRKNSDAWVERVILDGGASFRGNPAMRAHHELEASPEVLAALVELVQEFRADTECVAPVREPVVRPEERD